MNNGVTPYPVSPLAALLDALNQGVESYQQGRLIRQQRELQQLALQAQQQQLDANARQMFYHEQDRNAANLDRMMQDNTFWRLPDEEKTRLTLGAGRPAPIVGQTVTTPLAPQPNTSPLPAQMPLSALSAVQTQSTRVFPEQPFGQRKVGNLSTDQLKRMGLTDVDPNVTVAEGMSIAKAQRENTDYTQLNTPLKDLYANDPNTLATVNRFNLGSFTHKYIPQGKLAELAQVKFVGDLDATFKARLGLANIPDGFSLDQAMELRQTIDATEDKARKARLEAASATISKYDKWFERAPEKKWLVPKYKAAWSVLEQAGFASSGVSASAAPAASPLGVQINVPMFNPLVEGKGTAASVPSLLSLSPPAGEKPIPTNRTEDEYLPPPLPDTERTLLDLVGDTAEGRAQLTAAGIDPVLWGNKLSDVLGQEAVQRRFAPVLFKETEKKTLRTKLDGTRKMAEAAWSQPSFDPGTVRSYWSTYNGLVDLAKQQGYTDILMEFQPRTDIEGMIADRLATEKRLRDADLSRAANSGNGSRGITIGGMTYTDNDVRAVLDKANSYRATVAAGDANPNLMKDPRSDFAVKYKEAQMWLKDHPASWENGFREAYGLPLIADNSLDNYVSTLTGLSPKDRKDALAEDWDTVDASWQPTLRRKFPKEAPATKPTAPAKTAQPRVPARVEEILDALGVVVGDPWIAKNSFDVGARQLQRGITPLTAKTQLKEDATTALIRGLASRYSTKGTFDRKKAKEFMLTYVPTIDALELLGLDMKRLRPFLTGSTK